MLSNKKVRDSNPGLFYLFRFWCNQLISLSVNVDDLNGFIILQMLTQFGDVHIHASGIEIVVVNPNGLQSKVALQNIIGMSTKQAQQFGFLSCQLSLLFSDSKNLLLSIEGKLSYLLT